MSQNNHNDSRINTHSMSFKMYFAVFSAVMLVFSIFTIVYFLLDNAPNIHIAVKVITMILFIMIISIVTLFMFEYFRKLFFMKSIRLIQDVTKKVAQGDFSIHIEPQRTDGLIDEFEVIYEDLNAMISELDSVEMLRQDFVSNVSHELKTPLAIIQNYATALQSEHLSEEEMHVYSEKIVDVTKRLSVLISTILQLNKFENQKPTIKKTAFNLSEQINRCALKYESIWQDKNIEPIINVDQDIVLFTDEEMLDIVWDNLISNALKFTENNGTLTIESAFDKDKLLLKFKDNGIGISENAQKHIFDKFYQEDISHATKGNGLGLPLAKKILDILNCHIDVESKIGEGTTFSIHINHELIKSE